MSWTTTKAHGMRFECFEQHHRKTAWKIVAMQASAPHARQLPCTFIGKRPWQLKSLL
jgi:hypothetical protein